MIKKVIGLSGGGIGDTEVVNTRFTRHMQPVINPSMDAGALDSSQAWLMDVVDNGTEWMVYYTGANTQPILYLDGNTYDNTDSTYLAIKTKSNDVLTGWNKYLDINGDPKPILSPSFVNGTYDKFQIWLRTVIYEGGTYKGWFNADKGVELNSYTIGYATSPDGIVWTKYGSTYIYSDLFDPDGRGIVSFRVLHDETNYKMIYCGVDPNTRGLFIAQSSDGITDWARTHSNLFQNQNFGFPSDFKKINGVYYLWTQRINMMPAGNLGPCREVIVYSSTDLTTWTNLGVQLRLHGVAQEFGIGLFVKALQKPNGDWFMLHNHYINRTQALDVDSNTKEPALGTKVAESNSSTSFIMNSQCDFSWPDFVTFHAPLDPEGIFTEVITNTTGTLSSGFPSWWERGFIRLTGSQVLTFANNGSVINGGNFGFKMRVEIKTGTFELFRIGNDILVTLETLKLRVRLSSNGSGYEKDYITNINISKPVGMDYFDDHIYIAFLWDGSTLRMWNDFVEFTAGEITKTVDNALTTVNNSGSNILIGQNAAIELRSVTIMNAPTATEVKELDI